MGDARVVSIPLKLIFVAACSGRCDIQIKVGHGKKSQYPGVAGDKKRHARSWRVRGETVVTRSVRGGELAEAMEMEDERMQRRQGAGRGPWAKFLACPLARMVTTDWPGKGPGLRGLSRRMHHKSRCCHESLLDLFPASQHFRFSKSA